MSRRQLSVEYTTDGQLSAYLHMKDKRKVTVHFGFALVNFSDEKKSKRLGRQFEMMRLMP